MNKEFYILRYERTEYAKRIRKDYESKRIKERRCNMRKWGIRHDGICNTLSTVQKDNYLLEVTYKDDRDMNNSTGDFIKENNRNAKHQQDLLQHKDDVCRCVPAGTHGSTPHLTKTVVSDSPLRIRKLTPKECFRLMGFDDEDFYKAEAVNSNTQLYKQAGNSIVVDVLEAIFTNLKPYLSERE